MSTKGYTPKPYKQYVVEFTYLKHDELFTGRIVSAAQTEEEALEEVKAGSLVSHLPGFSVKVIEERTYSK